jgi:hypothetical protein
MLPQSELRLYRHHVNGPDENILSFPATNNESFKVLHELLDASITAAAEFPFEENISGVSSNWYEMTYPAFTGPETHLRETCFVADADDAIEMTAMLILSAIDYARRVILLQNPSTIDDYTTSQELNAIAHAELTAFEAEMEGAVVDGRWAAYLERQDQERIAEKAEFAARVNAKPVTPVVHEEVEREGFPTVQSLFKSTSAAEAWSKLKSWLNGRVEL